jgi:hypothetical protein
MTDGCPGARQLTLAPAPQAVVLPEAAHEYCMVDASLPVGGPTARLSTHHW